MTDTDLVTHRDIYVAITRVETKVEAHSLDIHDMKKRLGVLEIFKAQVGAYALVGAAVGSLVVQLLLGVMK